MIKKIKVSAKNDVKIQDEENYLSELDELEIEEALLEDDDDEIEITDSEIEDAEIKDVNLATREGPSGEKVEPNKYFTLYYDKTQPSTGLDYPKSTDDYFHPNKFYYKKEGNARIAKATPANLGLYEHKNVLTRNGAFKEGKIYYKDPECEIKATPANCNLVESASSKYAYYKLCYAPYASKAIGKLYSFTPNANGWKYAQEAYNYCVQNDEELAELFENEGKGAVLDKINQDNPDIAPFGDYTSARGSIHASVGAQNSINKTINRSNEPVASEGRTNYVGSEFLKERKQTEEEFVKSVSKRGTALTDEEKALMNRLFTRVVLYNSSSQNYETTCVRLNGKYPVVPEGEANENKTIYRIKYPTLQSLKEAIQTMYGVQGNYLRNVVASKSDEEKAEILEQSTLKLVKELNGHLIFEKDKKLEEEQQELKTNDSAPFKYVTYEMKDDKKVITGYYRTLEDAEEAEEEKKLVQEEEGLFYNEQTGKYLLMPIVEITSEDGTTTKEKFRLGEFEDYADAIDALDVFNGVDHDITLFLNTPYAKAHKNAELKEAYNYYYNDLSNTVNLEQGGYGIEKTESGKYRVWFTDPETRKKSNIGPFASKTDAEAFIKKGGSDPENVVSYLKKYKGETSNFKTQEGKPINTLIKNQIERENLTRSDFYQKLQNVEIPQLTEEELKKILSGSISKSKQAGMYKVFSNLIKFMKKNYTNSNSESDELTQEDENNGLTYANINIWQSRLRDQLLKIELDKFKQEVLLNIDTYRNLDLEKFVKQGINYIIKQVGTDTWNTITSENIRKQCAKQLKYFYDLRVK